MIIILFDHHILEGKQIHWITEGIFCTANDSMINNLCVFLVAKIDGKGLPSAHLWHSWVAFLDECQPIIGLYHGSLWSNSSCLVVFRWFFWLVVYLPLWKIMEFVSWDYEFPNIWKVIKAMFQTSNQFCSHQLHQWETSQISTFPGSQSTMWASWTGFGTCKIFLICPRHSWLIKLDMLHLPSLKI